MKKRLKKRKQWKYVLRRTVFLVVGLAALCFFGTWFSFQFSFQTGDYPASLKSGDYPASLIELAEKNPEAVSFVKNYPNKKDYRGEIDVTKELTEGIPLLLQWDERWGYIRYGGDFLAVTGCGPTCLSMVWCGLNKKGIWSPDKVAEMAEKSGYYAQGQGSSWDLMTGGAGKLGLRAERVIFDEKHIKETLYQKKPIICAMGPGDFTTQGHFIVLTGINDDGKILLNDPNSRKRSGKSWDLKKVMPQIRNLWAYSLKTE